MRQEKRLLARVKAFGRLDHFLLAILLSTLGEYAWKTPLRAPRCYER